jgi:uncharacterized protein YeaO (DUF488 family)
MEIKIKRVYDTPSSGDGYRVLVDKLWPRGMKKENLKYDVWEKNITPSTELRKWFHENPEEHWKEFSKKYADELKASPDAANFAAKIKGKKTVTLLYAAKDETKNHALVLRLFLLKTLSK